MTRLLLLLTILATIVGGCTAGTVPSHPAGQDPGSITWLPGSSEASASSEFWQHWGDGKAEMASYRTTIMRYGEPREAEMVLIYVTEPMNRETWIKDDDAEERVNVLKLNTSIKFLTGVYPYSIMSSVFSPVDDWGRERFTPSKIVFSAQEWCGIYTHLIWPGEDGFTSMRLSYFASDGEGTERMETNDAILYEDALPIQLRELDGPFADSGNWEGHMLPSTMHQRFVHRPTETVPARITRTDAGDVTRFELTYEGGFTRTFEIEKQPPKRLMGWYTSQGDSASLIESTRMPYWELNGSDDVSRRAEIGL